MARAMGVRCLFLGSREQVLVEETWQFLLPPRERVCHGQSSCAGRCVVRREPYSRAYPKSHPISGFEDGMLASACEDSDKKMQEEAIRAGTGPCDM